MLRLILVCLLGFFIQCLSAQQNPFDLKFRKPSPKSEIKPVPPPSKDTTALVIKSTPVIPPAKPDISSKTVKRDTQPVTVRSNPFEKSIIEAGDSTLTTEKAVKEIKTIVPAIKEPRRPSKGVQIFFLLLSLLFLIFIVNVERSFVRDLWKVISNENYSSLHLRNQRNTMRQILLLMGYFVFIIQAGIFLYHTLVIFNYQGTLLDNVWTCMALILVVYTIRHSVIGYLRWLFNNQKEMTLFSFDISIFNIMVGLVLLPINVIINFGPDSLTKPLIIIGLIVVLVAYLMRQLRWMLTARQLIANSLFLFFVYLCAIEILPLWAISKLFW